MVEHGQLLGHRHFAPASQDMDAEGSSGVGRLGWSIRVVVQPSGDLLGFGRYLCNPLKMLLEVLDIRLFWSYTRPDVGDHFARIR